jgi:hypothetical protein
MPAMDSPSSQPAEESRAAANRALFYIPAIQSP